MAIFNSKVLVYNPTSGASHHSMAPRSALRPPWQRRRSQAPTARARQRWRAPRHWRCGHHSPATRETLRPNMGKMWGKMRERWEKFGETKMETAGSLRFEEIWGYFGISSSFNSSKVGDILSWSDDLSSSSSDTHSPRTVSRPGLGWIGVGSISVKSPLAYQVHPKSSVSGHSGKSMNIPTGGGLLYGQAWARLKPKICGFKYLRKASSIISKAPLFGGEGLSSSFVILK